MRRIRLSQDFGRILKVPPKLAAGSRQNSQAGGLRYVAKPSRLRVRGASEPHVPSHRQPLTVVLSRCAPGLLTPWKILEPSFAPLCARRDNPRPIVREIINRDSPKALR